MEWSFAIPLSAVVISLATLVYSAITFRYKADESSAVRHDAELKELRTSLANMRLDHIRELGVVNSRLAACELARDNLVLENLTLMRQALGLPPKTTVLGETP